MAHIKIDKKIAKYRVQKPEAKDAAAPVLAAADYNFEYPRT